MTARLQPAVSPVKAALGCRCPRCGGGRLFSGFLEVAERCESCGLDLRAQDSADGPAVFVIFILGFVVVGLAILIEVVFAPPYWVHVVLWPPVVIGLSLLMLRPLKAAMIAAQFKHNILDQDD
jgi:uncharacterized protein (DUF983 family)